MNRVRLVAFCVLILTGCGGSDHLSKSAFQQKLGPLGERFQKDGAPLLSAHIRTRRQLVAAIDSARAAYSRFADQLARLDAPTDVKAARDTVVRTLRQGAALSAEVRDAFRTRDKAKLTAVTRRMAVLKRTQDAVFEQLHTKLVAR